MPNQQPSSAVYWEVVRHANHVLPTGLYLKKVVMTGIEPRYTQLSAQHANHCAPLSMFPLLAVLYSYIDLSYKCLKH